MKKVVATIEAKLKNDCPPNCRGSWCDHCPFIFESRKRTKPAFVIATFVKVLVYKPQSNNYKVYD